jgi:predicted DNA repair protein MutK
MGDGATIGGGSTITKDVPAGSLAVARGIDDIATVLDDVAVLTKVAAKKTAGVLGDDLALNAQQVTGVRPTASCPVVWAVAKGSLVNKAILVPAALAISAFAPWLITPLLMVGGAFLCFEGVEKLAHKCCTARPRTKPTRRADAWRWPTRPSTWWRWRRTRSRARCAPTSSCRPRSS